MPSISDLHFKSFLIYTGVLAIEVMKERFEEMLEVSIGALDESIWVEVLVREVYVVAVHPNSKLNTVNRRIT
jgi:hypothetical protein